jgi:acetyl-CoA C-acetyltransferase
MLRGVSIIGIGSTPFSKLKGMSLKSLAVKACSDALEDAGVTVKEISAFYLGNMASGPLAGQETPAGQVARELGLLGVPIVRVEGACCSGSIALREAYIAVASGFCDFALVCGVEKMTDAPTEKVTETLANSMDAETESLSGATFPGFFAMIMRRYMHEYKCKREQFAMVAVKNRKNAVKNPRAQFRKEVTLEEVLSSRIIADPIRLYECCPISDGAAAAVICPSDIAKKYTDTPIEIIASVVVNGYSSLSEHFDYGYTTSLPCTLKAAELAYKMAKIEPKDVDVVELHDCFTPAEIIDSEDLGFFKKGEGAKAVEEGLTEVGGKIAINPSGGLLSKGHPVGATGLGQLYEVVLQLRGEHENQVPGAEIGLTHNAGGPGVVCSVHILRRR